MSGSNESHLVAVVLPPPDAADAIRRSWDRDAAVVVIDPSGPGVDARIVAVAPTHVTDADGTRPWRGGRPVPSGVGAVVATSGTTGSARFVELTMDALTASAAAVHRALEVDPDQDRWLACLPLHSIAGLAIVARGYVSETPVIVHPRFDVHAVADAAGTASLVSLVPTTVQRLLAADPTALARFRHVLIGGAPIPDALLQPARDAQVNIVTTYGLTETGGGCVHDGHPLAGVGIDLAPETGEILVHGPVVMRGYRARTPTGTDPDEPGVDPAPDSWRNGWLRTGDVGRWDADGRLAVIDRIKDLIITGGSNVSPLAVERALREVAGVRDIAVIGAPDREWGERVVACIVARDASSPPSLDAIRAAGAARGLRPAELPREVRIVDSIPRTLGGKTLRRALREAPTESPPA